MKYVAISATMPPCGMLLSQTMTFRHTFARILFANHTCSPYTNKDGRTGFLVRAYRALTSVCGIRSKLSPPFLYTNHAPGYD